MGNLPDMWKKFSILPLHKKGDKQAVNDYKQVSLLTIIVEIFERILFYSFLGYQLENLSGFQNLQSWKDQLVSIAHDNYAITRRNSPVDVRSVF